MRATITARGRGNLRSGRTRLASLYATSNRPPAALSENFVLAVGTECRRCRHPTPTKSSRQWKAGRETSLRNRLYRSHGIELAVPRLTLGQRQIRSSAYIDPLENINIKDEVWSIINALLQDGSPSTGANICCKLRDSLGVLSPSDQPPSQKEGCVGSPVGVDTTKARPGSMPLVWWQRAS
ncbi:hypothetical protein LZ30DRAFT_439100 [Colletotrichum cereale]|nr:hypothetical protein LZ30DRAFT_439100 [Colletotrichum cereale]